MGYIEKWNKKWESIEKKDKAAKQKGIITGRYIKEPYADGNAFYEIKKELQTKVRIKVIQGIGDDWIIPYWGIEATIDKNYALENICRRDNVNKLFKGG